MKLKLYALLLAAVASVSSAGLASAAPAVPDRLYFPNDRGTGWIYIDNDNTQVPRFSKDKIGNVTSFSMHAYSETAGSKLFFLSLTPRRIASVDIPVPPIAFIPLAATAGTAPRTKCWPLANTPPTATAR